MEDAGASTTKHITKADFLGDAADYMDEESIPTELLEDEAVTAEKTDFGGSYSTSEVDTGFTWVDGKTIYKKTISTGAINADKTVAHGITGLDSLVEIRGTAVNNSGDKYPLPLLSSLSGAGTIGISAGAANITIGVDSNPGIVSSNVTLFYTKD